MDSHLFGDSPEAAGDRKTRSETFRAKHRDEIQNDE